MLLKKKIRCFIYLFYLAYILYNTGLIHNGYCIIQFLPKFKRFLSILVLEPSNLVGHVKKAAAIQNVRKHFEE